MIIPKEILTECKKGSCDWYSNYTEIAGKDIAILAVFHLHKQKIINDTSFNAYCRKYKDGTLIRKVNTFHSKVNDKWYNDESTFTIIMDLYNEKCYSEDFRLEEMLMYLNKLYNRNRNYCIDVVYFQYVEPILNRWDYNNFTLFNAFEFNIQFETYEQMDNYGRLSDGYCCSDCDGCLGEYKRQRYRDLVGPESKHITEIKAYLNTQKNDSGRRNPKNRLGY